MKTLDEVEDMAISSTSSNVFIAPWNDLIPL
jgi:hypothetical protein